MKYLFTSSENGNTIKKVGERYEKKNFSIDYGIMYDSIPPERWPRNVDMMMWNI